MEARTETQILLDMVAKAEQQKLISTDDEVINRILNGVNTENQYIMDLSTHAYILAQDEKLIEECYNLIDINKATGEQLDNIGALFNVTRIPAMPPLATLTISTDAPLTEDVVIPAGTKVQIKEIYKQCGNYITSNEVTLLANTSNVEVQIEGEYGFYPTLPKNATNILVGFETLTISNTQSTNGNNIEEDDDYRERIKQWNSKNSRGTEACLTDYLNHYEGIDGYKLIPMFNGVGTLKIVADTLESLTEQISEDVYDNCLIFTDAKPVVELPKEVTIEKIQLNINRNTNLSVNIEELITQLIAQTQVYIDGGTTRNGAKYEGLNIGSAFYPAHFNQFILNQFPEVSNIFLKREVTESKEGTIVTEFINFMEPLVIDDDSILHINDVQVVIL